MFARLFLLAIAALIGSLVVQSLPDIARYLEMRRM
ncbi:hypothetical protein BH24CHL2_BH24CHL2_2070 [soil metagenome]|jgi:hypothetical protein